MSRQSRRQRARVDSTTKPTAHTRGAKTVASSAFSAAPSGSAVAIANPDAAPYGAAAVQAMQNLKVYDLLAPKIVEGSSITQTFQFVATGNAEIGFVAGAQLGERGGSAWIVDPSLYDPIRRLNKVNLVIQQAAAAATRVRDLLEVPLDITERPDALVLRGVERSIAWEAVEFGYGDAPVLRGIDLEVQRGEGVADDPATDLGRARRRRAAPRRRAVRPRG